MAGISLHRYTLTIGQYRESRQHIFQSDNSLRWFIDRNRAALERANAFIRPAKDYLIDPDAFDGVVAAVGKQRSMPEQENRQVNPAFDGPEIAVLPPPGHALYQGMDQRAHAALNEFMAERAADELALRVHLWAEFERRRPAAPQLPLSAGGGDGAASSAHLAHQAAGPP